MQVKSSRVQALSDVDHLPLGTAYAKVGDQLQHPDPFRCCACCRHAAAHSFASTLVSRNLLDHSSKKYLTALILEAKPNIPRRCSTQRLRIPHTDARGPRYPSCSKRHGRAILSARATPESYRSRH